MPYYRYNLRVHQTDAGKINESGCIVIEILLVFVIIICEYFDLLLEANPIP